jgi:serine/threonine protein kinase
MNCPNCQRPVREGAQFCTNCGTRTSRDDEPSADSVPPSAEAVPTIENPAGGAAETSANRGTETEPDGDPLLGRVLDGKYEIIAPLGAGGMGSVYRARRVLIGDEVAVKVLHTKFVNDDTLVARFRREARAAAQLHHPNVVTIHDYGEARGPRGFAYIVMELVRGDSLRALIRREGRMDVARAVSLMRDVCAGVGAAHRRGIVHRDIKPDNIIVVPADEDAPTERVKVVDFGIAKLRDMASDGTLTEEGDVVGTPYYMSPEQCHGEHLDVRADVYSLGALLYEMLAGIWPFNAPSLAGIILKHVSEPPPPLPPDVPAPPALSDAIARALSKVPDERQRDATEFAREIQAAAVAPASRSTHEPHVLPFSETTRPAPVTPLPARDQNPAPTPTPPLPLTRPDVLSDTRPHTPAALTHGGARRKRSRAPP